MESISFKVFPSHIQHVGGEKYIFRVGGEGHAGSYHTDLSPSLSHSAAAGNSTVLVTPMATPVSIFLLQPAVPNYHNHMRKTESRKPSERFDGVQASNPCVIHPVGVWSFSVTNIRKYPNRQRVAIGVPALLVIDMGSKSDGPMGVQSLQFIRANLARIRKSECLEGGNLPYLTHLWSSQPSRGLRVEIDQSSPAIGRTATPTVP